MSHVVSLLFHDVYATHPSESGFSSPAADRYKLTTSEFEEQIAGVASSRQRALLLPDDLLDSLRRDRPGFILTVDDGGLSYYTELAGRLETRGWRGACFVSTDFIGRPGFLEAGHIRDLDARGHLIGSHSASHPTRFSACTRNEMDSEWTRSRKRLEDVLGHPVTVASLPGGYFSREVAQAAADAGIQLLFTSEPTTSFRSIHGCLVAGRFTIRPGCRPHHARALVSPARWSRFGAWASWNAKGLIKPLLGESYPSIADRLFARKTLDRTSSPS
jgi:peptidoglycan/xylan/chitin deacetylase (PgdA/CDA1 family)